MNGIDMQSLIDPPFRSTPAGDVWLIRQSGNSGYTGPGGTWQAAKADPVQLTMVNIQPLKPREAESLMTVGAAGVSAPISVNDCRVVHLNDGTYLQCDDEAQEADMLRFSDGLQMREWRVIAVDNRPWHHFCRAVVQRYRGAG
ncbi:hypothetical protein [Zymobacter palmae]|uniref:Uncharacterized protein n=1 Tax=Zymobacter palmae TaxID=33074 RepID=A0A348HEB7_9GAMM|nr:hypothetical protein [Zymobacter palmae]BBG29969.1 hypothetical protein ZBT109_1209 [Zymobacter palmae]